jgi:hypothetical protein
MTKSDVTFTEATPELARAYYGSPPPYSFKGYVALLDGKPIGIGGVFFNGGPVAFSEMKEEMRPRTKDKARAVRVLERLINTYKCPVVAVAAEPTSVPLLTKLGFELTGHEEAQGPVMVKQPEVSHAAD